MDWFEYNKIVGAVLATALAVFGLSFLADFVYEPIATEEPAYVIAVATESDGTDDDEVAEEPIAVRLQVADVGAGQSQAKKCLACHAFEAGAPAKVGPNLWDIVERPLASAGDFGYSSALLEAAGDGDTWTYELLDAFLAAPKTALPGTSMAFVGLKRPEQRADVIAYLRGLSDAPVPLPQVAEAEGNDAAAEAPSAD